MKSSQALYARTPLLRKAGRARLPVVGFSSTRPRCVGWSAIRGDTPMGGIIALIYGVVCYLAFFLSFLYAIAFVEGLPVPKTLDSAPPGPFWPSFIIDVAVLGVFAV